MAVGCLLVAAGVWLAEKVAETVSPGRPVPEERSSRQYFEESEALGWQPMASVQASSQLRLGEQILYDVVYTFDGYRRRVVPADPHAEYHRFLLFFGCSNTFGEGVQDDETLPYDVSRLMPGVHVYNYAFRGYGPQHMLARVESSDLRREVAEPEGTAVYLFPSFHLNRLIGGSSTMSWAKRNLPYYRMENGEPVRDGFFQTTRPLYSFFARTVGQSRLMQILNLAWPPRVRPEHLQLACAVLAKSRRLLREQLGPLDLIVVLYPTQGGVDLASCLNPLGIPLLDYHDAFPDPVRAQFQIPIDLHTNARGNHLLAERLARDLDPLVPRQH